MEHKEISLDLIDKVLTFIRKNATKLADEADQKSFKEILGYLETAKTLADDNKKRTCLYDAATKYSNQLAFRLFIEGNLDDATAKTFASFETVKVVSGYAYDYTQEDKARADAITKAQQDYMAEREPFEIFKGVIGGMSEDEAKQKMEEYKARQAEGIANAVANGQI